MSWIAAGFILLGQLALERRLRRGWLYAVTGNGLFMMQFWGQDMAIVFLNAVMLVVSIRGYRAWRTEH